MDALDMDNVPWKMANTAAIVLKDGLEVIAPLHWNLIARIISTMTAVSLKH